LTLSSRVRAKQKKSQIRPWHNRFGLFVVDDNLGEELAGQSVEFERVLWLLAKR